MQKAISVNLIVCSIGTAAFVVSLFFYVQAALLIADYDFLQLHAGMLASCATVIIIALIIRSSIGSAFLKLANNPKFFIGILAIGVFCWIAVFLSSAAVQYMFQTVLLVASAVCYSISACLFYLLWGGIWGSLGLLEDDYPLLFGLLCVSFLVAFFTIGILLWLLGLSPAEGAPYFIVALVALVVTFSCLVALRGPEQDVAAWQVSKEKEEKRTHMVLRSFVAAFTLASVIMVYADGLGIMQTLAGLSCGCALSSAGLLAYVAAKKETPSFFIEPYAFFVLEIGLLLTIVFGVSFPTLVLMSTAFGVQYLMYYLALNVTVKKMGTNPFEHFALRFNNVALGLSTGFVAALLCLFSLPARFGLMVICLICLIALMVNHLKDPTYWLEWGALHRLANGYSEMEESVVVSERARAVLRWEETCDVLARSFDLSDRERDVFILLAKGRNAAMIAEKLFISQNTARTHIYRIYSKTNLKNQQELITLVENEQQRRKAELQAESESC